MTELLCVAVMDVMEIRRAVALEDGNWWYAARRRLIAREIEDLPPGRALDVGAAGGGNTRVLAERGWQAIATDFSPAAVDLARERGLTARQADARDLPFGDGEFDLVTSFDVLEHILEHRAAATEIARVLRPGGIALISVPCDMALWSAHDEVLGHVRRYSKDTLRDLLEGAGLTVDALWSWNVLLRPVAQWRRKKATGCDLEELPRAVNAALSAVLRLESVLPVRSLPGVSLVARCRRIDR